ncbi:MAG: glycoside hydrolase [Actinomycetota bacterium]|nr:glycoside hydrolase [Actinomycetota bacterium]
MKRVAMLVCVCLLVVGMTAGAGARQGPGSDEAGRFFLRHRALKALAAADATAAPGAFLPSSRECTVRGAPDNLNLDCDDPEFESPNNEPHIVVDPEDPQHMIASSNDYESCCDEFYTTFDGGKTWKTGDMSAESPNEIGSDPVTAIDPVSGNAIHSSLNFEFTDDGLATNGDVVVSLSEDGGLTWGEPVVVQRGRGDDDDPVQLFNDKQWVLTDTNPDSPYYGRTYLTWSRFRAESGVYVESPIFESHSDDGGETWSDPQEISGRSPTCTYQEAGGGRDCDEDQGSVPAVAPDGTVYVSFQNAQHEAAWEAGEQFEDQYMVVRSEDGGETWDNPVSVADMEDGSRDFPLNVDDRQTLTNYQLRVPTFGHFVSDPNSGRLYLVFTDNRAGRHDVARPVTDTNVFITSSADGIKWTTPSAVTSRTTDQWFPSVDVNPVTGEVGVLYHDRIEDGFRDRLYTTTLAEGRPGAWTYTRVASAGSHPRNSLYFRAAEEGCWKCSVFHGDYISLDYGSDGSANAVWTDMRRYVDLGVPGGTGFTENIFFSRL